MATRCTPSCRTSITKCLDLEKSSCANGAPRKAATGASPIPMHSAASSTTAAIVFAVTRIPPRDRKSVVQGKRVSVRVDIGGRRIIKKKHNNTTSKTEENSTEERNTTG